MYMANLDTNAKNNYRKNKMEKDDDDGGWKKRNKKNTPKSNFHYVIK
jgi:hypothetical protein